MLKMMRSRKRCQARCASQAPEELAEPKAVHARCASQAPEELAEPKAVPGTLREPGTRRVGALADSDVAQRGVPPPRSFESAMNVSSRISPKPTNETRSYTSRA